MRAALVRISTKQSSSERRNVKGKLRPRGRHPAFNRAAATLSNVGAGQAMQRSLRSLEMAPALLFECVEVIGPELHHPGALCDVLRTMVGIPVTVFDYVSQLELDQVLIAVQHFKH